MCKPISCPTCNNITWIGCGLHIPFALSAASKDQWCICIHKDGTESKYPPKAGEGVLPPRDGEVALYY